MIVFSAELMDHIPLLTLIAVYTKDGFPDAAKKKKKNHKKHHKKAWDKKILPRKHNNNSNNGQSGIILQRRRKGLSLICIVVSSKGPSNADDEMCWGGMRGMKMTLFH